MDNCIYCNFELHGSYCSNCGQPAKLKRIDSKYMKEEIGQVIQFEKGIFFTIKELLIRPGKSIREFIAKDRNRLVKPLLFIIITSLVYNLIEHYFVIENAYIKYEGSKDNMTFKIFDWIQGNYGYTNIILGFFIAFWTKILFRRYGYNIYEILVLMCFTLGIVMLLWSTLATIERLTNVSLMQYASLVGIAYTTWAIGVFFEKRVKNYLKAFGAYILGSITFGLTALLLGILIDIILSPI